MVVLDGEICPCQLSYFDRVFSVYAVEVERLPRLVRESLLDISDSNSLIDEFRPDVMCQHRGGSTMLNIIKLACIPG